MRIHEFCKLYRLKLTRDECGEEIIPGELGHVFDHGDGRFGMVLEDTPSGPSRARLLLSRKKAALRAGFLPKQNGECESVLLFDPQNQKQAELAAKLVMAKKERTVRVSPASLLNLVRPSTQPPSQPPGIDILAEVKPGGLGANQPVEIPDEGSRAEGLPKAVAA